MQTWDTHRASDDAALTVYRAAPGAGRHPALVVFPSIFGITADLCAYLDELAAAGTVAVAFDPFSRGDGGPLPEAEAERAMTRLRALDMPRADRDLRELAVALADDPRCAGVVFGLGICLGGSFVVDAALDGVLAGAATWHGSRLGRLLGDGRARLVARGCPLSLDFGDADGLVPATEVEAVKAAFGDQPGVEVRVHPGADHGFSLVGASTYHEAAATAARRGLERMIATARNPTAR